MTIAMIITTAITISSTRQVAGFANRPASLRAPSPRLVNHNALATTAPAPMSTSSTTA